MPDSPDYLLPHKWTYLYDVTPLKRTLKQYIDFDQLKKINTASDLRKNNSKTSGQYKADNNFNRHTERTAQTYRNKSSSTSLTFRLDEDNVKNCVSKHKSKGSVLTHL
jgi:hypothetical protein